jgi:WhiB family redox-sensing transcriptional regulator
MSNYATVTPLNTAARIPNCKLPDADPDAWFPHEPHAERTNERAAYETAARELCADCPLIAACLEQALTDESQYGIHSHGIFGGTAPWQRENMLRAVRRNAAKAVA